LEELCSGHVIAAELFVPFVIARLRAQTQTDTAMVEVTLRDIGGPGEVQRTLRLSWSADNIPVQPLGVQEHTVTEWAALCVLVAHYAALKIVGVAAPGDGFDYWVAEGKEQLGLEVSGTMMDDLLGRHREKLRQLRDNPHGVSGYVLVASFSTQRAILSFHRQAEAVP
jgi:hypothetical protein